MIGQHGLTNPDAPKAIARHELLCTLEDVLQAASVLLKPGGHFYMVHRPFRLAEILNGCVQYKLEPKRMQLVYPYVDKEPNMVLLEAVRGGRPRMTVEKPLIVYQAPASTLRKSMIFMDIKVRIMTQRNFRSERGRTWQEFCICVQRP